MITGPCHDAGVANDEVPRQPRKPPNSTRRKLIRQAGEGRPLFIAEALLAMLKSHDFAHPNYRGEVGRLIDAIEYLEAEGRFEVMCSYLEALDAFVRLDNDVARTKNDCECK